jgi:hypothetical protein
MSTPRDRDHPDEGTGEGAAWQEPAHLGGDDEARRDPAAEQPAEHPAESAPAEPTPAAWQPPGWDLPPATPARNEPVDPRWGPPTAAGPAPEPARGGLFGSRRGRDPEMARAFTYEGDLVGAQGWALQHGWTVSDGSGPEDAALRDLVDSAPVRLTKDHRAASVLRGRSGSLDLVAFDVLFSSGRYQVPEYAVTAAPLLGTVPVLRLSPARLWKHGVGGLVPVVSGDQAFDSRWVLLAAEDNPQVRRLAQDPAVHGLLLGTDDGDEFWTGAGHVAAIRPDGHRPALLEHHARLLAVIVQALAAGY